MKRTGFYDAWSTVAHDVTGDPARAVRIFKAGENPSTQGPVVFDEESAKLVIEYFAERGLDGMMIDLEHLSIDDEHPHFDPDARGHYQLEIRRDANGGPECWAIPTWNEDGTRRIVAKSQRFLSPFFAWKPREDGARRVVAIRNIGLVANPATHGAQPLIAASARSSRRTIPGRGPALQRGLIAMAAGTNAETLQKLMEAAGLAPDGPIGDLTAFLQATLMELQGQPAPTKETPKDGPTEAEALGAAPPAAKPEEDKPAVIAASARLMAMTGKSSYSAAVDETEKWRQSHIKLETEQKKLAVERAAMELTERRSLATELVKLGVEMPATIFADPEAPAGTSALSARILGEPIADLRKRTEAWRVAKGGKSPAPRPPTDAASVQTTEAGGREVTVDGQLVTLSAREVAGCEASQVPLEKYAARKLKSGIAA